MSNSSTHLKGFTLVEILVVMLITSVLVLGLNSALRQTHLVWGRTINERTMHQSSRMFVDVLRSELACLYVTDSEEDQPTSFSLSTFSDGSVKLSFLTLNPVFYRSTVSNLPAKVAYEYIEDSDTGRKMIVRSERLFSGEKAISESKSDIVLQGISGFNISVSGGPGNGIEWENQFQASPENHPNAVRVLLEWPGEMDFEGVLKIVSQTQIEMN